MIKGKAIVLRYVQAAELELLISLTNNSELKGDYTRTLLKSPASLRREFEANCFSTESSEMFVVADHANNILGVIGHFITAHYSSARELGFSIFAQENRNKGIATEAVRLLTAYLFASLPINRIQICMPVEHKSCEKVAINCGYKKEGILRGSIFVRGEYLDTYAYSMLRVELDSVM